MGEKMKQLITRIDPGLHAQLKRRADDEGRSLNSVVTEALEAAVEPTNPRAALRARARHLGIPLAGGYGPPPSKAEVERLNEERQKIAEGGRGEGPVLVDLILEDRGARD